MVIENIRMALLSLSQSKLRSFLTMLGIIIGVAAVLSITAIGQGVKDAVTDQVSGLGSNTISISSGGGSDFTGGIGSSTLTPADLATVQATANIDSASYFGLISGVLTNGSIIANGGYVVATTKDYVRVQDLSFSEGRFFNESEKNSNVAVISSGTKTQLFGDQMAVGKTITFRGAPLTIIGVIAPPESPSLFGGTDDATTYIPDETAAVITKQPVQIFQIIASVNSPENVEAAVENIQSKIKINHGDQQDFKVQTQADILSTFDTILTLLTTFIAAIAGISLLVGGIGIMNIMLVNVTERTKEIGLRKAIGASSTTVLGQFLVEAVILSLVGGGLGILVAMGIAAIAGRIADITPSFTPSSIIFAVGISVTVGIVFGIAPAIKAARMRPIQALKSQ